MKMLSKTCKLWNQFHVYYFVSLKDERLSSNSLQLLSTRVTWYLFLIICLTSKSFSYISFAKPNSSNYLFLPKGNIVTFLELNLVIFNSILILGKIYSCLWFLSSTWCCFQVFSRKCPGGLEAHLQWHQHSSWRSEGWGAGSPCRHAGSWRPQGCDHTSPQS